MPQVAPTYKSATGKPDPALVTAIVKKYGAPALIWPLVLSRYGRTQAYLYERNAINQINALADVRPQSRSGVASYFLDYTSTPRVFSPANSALEQLLLTQAYSNSYQFVETQSAGYSTVDLDYVWDTSAGWKGFELTTFKIPFSSEGLARQLVATIKNRPTYGKALIKILAAAQDLGIDFQMVVANSTGDPGTPIVTNGNVLYFKLTTQQIALLMAGEPLDNAVFCSFKDFVSQL